MKDGPTKTFSTYTDETIAMMPEMKIMELQKENDNLKAQLSSLELICERWFRDPMVQPYAGANRECMFCGTTQDRDGSTHHSYADCPHMKYLKYKGEIS